MNWREVNFDGLVGPTHNYGGLSFGNIASSGNAGKTSSPKTAALQGIQKMRAMVDMGLTQAVLPPHARPHYPTLRLLGFSGIAEVGAKAPELLAQLSSGAAMWAANAATVTPSLDSQDGLLHFTPANLVANPHRSIEGHQTARTLKAIFSNPETFFVHDPLPANSAFSDEGAANHSRLVPSHSERGVHMFVYGRTAGETTMAGGAFPRRHTLEASQAVARLHVIPPSQSIFVRQAARAIDGGAFHNDVVAVANESVLLYHEDAFDDPSSLLELFPFDVNMVQISREEVSLADSVGSYLFNSQLVTLDDGSMALITPSDVEENASAAACVRRLIADDSIPISKALSFDLRQSMQNGGGPACLRLRVVMSDAEISAMSGRVIVDHELLGELETWVERHYRDALRPEDLSDPALAQESEAALDELTGILELGAIYYFQDK